MSQPQIHFVTSSDGVALALHTIPTEGKRVLLVPGTFSNHTFWFGTRGVGFGRALANDGFEPWSLDLRGHGKSARPADDDAWSFDDWILKDIPAAIRHLTPDQEALVVAHSAGGAAVLAALAADSELRERVRAMVIVATPIPWLQGYRKLLSRTVRAASVKLGYFPARLLKLGPEDEMPHVMEQWMRWNLDGRWTSGDGIDYAERLTEIDVPFLAVAASGDHLWAPPPACRALYSLVGSSNKQYLVCGTGSGFSEDFTHAGVIVSRAASKEVWPILLKWLRRNG